MKQMISAAAIVACLVGCGEATSSYHDYRDRADAAAAAAEGRAAPAPAARQAWSGPFGLQAGLSVAEIQAAGHRLVEVEPWHFGSEDVPTPHRQFRAYLLDIGPETGLCAITAVGVNFQADSHGNAIRQRFEGLQAALVERYGEPGRVVDTVQRRSVYEAPEYFTMALERGERSLHAAWDFADEEVVEKGVESIALVALSPEHMTGQISLQYRFPNHAECEVEMNALKNRGL